MVNVEELARICNNDFCSKKRTCGILVQGGNSSLRENVVSELRVIVAVPVYTPDFKPPEGQYVFDLNNQI